MQPDSLINCKTCSSLTNTQEMETCDVGLQEILQKNISL